MLPKIFSLQKPATPRLPHAVSEENPRVMPNMPIRGRSCSSRHHLVLRLLRATKLGRQRPVRIDATANVATGCHYDLLILCFLSRMPTSPIDCLLNKKRAKGNKRDKLARSAQGQGGPPGGKPHEHLTHKGSSLLHDHVHNQQPITRTSRAVNFISRQDRVYHKGGTRLVHSDRNNRHPPCRVT